MQNETNLNFSCSRVFVFILTYAAVIVVLTCLLLSIICILCSSSSTPKCLRHWIPLYLERSYYFKWVMLYKLPPDTLIHCTCSFYFKNIPTRHMSWIIYKENAEDIINQINSSHTSQWHHHNNDFSESFFQRKFNLLSLNYESQTRKQSFVFSECINNSELLIYSSVSWSQIVWIS